MTITADAIPGYAPGTWKLDPSHSEVSFSVRHLAISKVKGTFEAFDATVEAAESPLDSKVTATVEVASVNTKNADRDGHLRTNDFFLADEHPQFTFVSTGVRAEGDDYFIDGDLTLRGVTKPVSFAAEFGGITTDPWGNTKAGIEASTKVNRHDFGISWNAALEAGGFMLGDDVTINLDLQFAKA